MKVKVDFSSLVADVTGKSSVEINVPEHYTVRQLTELLAAEYGRGFRRLLFSDRGELRRLAHVVINGRDVGQEAGGLDTKLQDGVQVSFVFSLTQIPAG